jgi:hypothetical protein
MKSLPQTGTVALLETLSPYLDNDFLNDLFPRRRTQGRHRLFSPAQLFRVLLLGLLTPAHSFNLLVRLLADHRCWRDFAFLSNKRVLPDAKMLHQFRDRLDLIKLRTINQYLLSPLLGGLDPARKTVAIIDSTDLPAGTNPFKKKKRESTRRDAPQSACARARAIRAAGLSDIRNTLCVFGFRKRLDACYWCL